MTLSLKDLKGKKVVILGLGKNKQGSGVGAAKWCLRQGMRVLITDMNKREDLPLTVAEVEKAYRAYKQRGLKVYQPIFVMGKHRNRDIDWSDMVIQNPAVRFDNQFLLRAISKRKMVETDLSLFFKFCPFPIIGITGTRGKTTTTMLSGAILAAHDKRAVLGGNMRVSPLESLDKILKSSRPMPIVLEISSWQAEALARIKRSPQIAAITNLSEDHLNVYGTMKKYAAAKENLFRFQKKHDVGIFNFDNAFTKSMGRRAKGYCLWTSLKPVKAEHGVFIRGQFVVLRHSNHEHKIFSVKDIALEGKHNISNVLTAVAVAAVSGVSAETIRKVVKSFKGVEHRQEFVRSWQGIDFVNDTTATSPEGALAALERFKDRKIVLLGGGVDKNFDMRILAKRFSKLKYAVLFKGSATDKLLAVWPNKDKPHVVDSMNAALSHALQAAERGDLVLLSPGAASFGVFQNEFDRGEQFVKQVKALK